MKILAEVQTTKDCKCTAVKKKAISLKTKKTSRPISLFKVEALLAQACQVQVDANISTRATPQASTSDSLIATGSIWPSFSLKRMEATPCANSRNGIRLRWRRTQSATLSHFLSRIQLSKILKSLKGSRKALKAKVQSSLMLTTKDCLC